MQAMHGTISAFQCQRDEEASEGSLHQQVAEEPESSLDRPAAEVPELAASNRPMNLPTSNSFQSTSASSLPGSAPRATRSPCWADLCEDSASDGEPSSSSLPPVSVRSLPARVDSDSSLAPVSSDEQGNRPEEDSSLSVGSRDHASGNCHPCIFFPKAQGCVYGWHCTFCHFDHDSKSRHRRHLRGGRRRDPDVVSVSGTTGSEAESGSTPSAASVEEKFLLPSALVYHMPQQPWPTGPLPPRSALRGRGKGRGRRAPGAAGSPSPADAPYPETADGSLTSMLTSVFAPWFSGEASSSGAYGAAELRAADAIVEESSQSCSGAEAAASSKDKRYRTGGRSQGGHPSSESSNKDASSEGTPVIGQWSPGGTRPSRTSAHGAGTDRRHKPRNR